MECHELRFRVMGCQAHLIVLGGPPDLVRWAKDRLEDLERRWSRFLPDSELSQLNRSQGRPVVVSPETFRVVDASIRAWYWSDGRFDPTVGTTMVAAGYDSPMLASERPTRTGHHLPCPTPVGIHLDPYPGSISLPPGMSLDLGGIGKGAAADLLANELMERGALGCSINVGGDVRVTGQAPSERGWHIAIRAGGYETTVAVHEGAVCTSGLDGRSWTSELGIEHHLRDPQSGASVASGLAAVSVIGARALQAEVLTMTAMAAGPIEAPTLITSVGATGVLIHDDRTVEPLAGLSNFLVSEHQAGMASPGISTS